MANENMQKIKLTKAPSTENMVCRLISEEAQIEMGVYPVIFGFRVRAGYIGMPCCEIDWCCGDDQLKLEGAYSICKKILEQDGDFNNMLPRSKIKPYFNDLEFTSWLNSYIDSNHVIDKLPSLEAIKYEYFSLVRKLGAL